MKIAVFCSANNNIESQYFTLTQQLGEWMAKKGHTLIYGGCNLGLMECVAKAVHTNGGRTIGVIPSIREKEGQISEYLDVEIPTDSLSDRKDLMLNQCDVCIALPGGIGTLDELFSVAASHFIGYHHKIVILYNMSGFWNSLIALLDNLKDHGMIRGSYHKQIKVANNLQDIEKIIEEER